MTYWYERYFGADYWVYAGAEYTAERTAAEVEYLAAVLGGGGTPGSPATGRRVLDVGCGIGRHSIGLARRGFRVVGVDVSQWAVDAARAAAEAAGVTAQFHRLDALRAPAGQWPVREVDAVVCVQSFGWGSDADQLAMLRTLRRLLVPGGLIVLDHSNVSAILRMYASRSVATVDGHTFEFERSYDPLTGRSGGVLVVNRPTGETVRLPDDVRIYQPPEVAALLTRAGFRVCRADADFRPGAAVGLDTRYVQFVGLASAPVVSALAGHRSPVGPGELDLRWAPDEASLSGHAVAQAWRTAAGPGALDRARRYDLADPYAAHRSVGALSAHFAAELRPAQVTAGAGATGLLRALAGLAAGRDVLVDPAGHPELALAAQELLASVRTGNPADETAVCEARAAVTVLDRPGVTGRVAPTDLVGRLAEAAAGAGGVLVVDETCASYLPAVESAAALVAGGTPGLVVVRSMSKGYCCGGLRIGFALSSPDVAERVRAVCAPLAVGALALDVALDLLRQGDVLADLRARVAQVKPRFVELLAAAGVDADAGDPRLPWVTVPATALPVLAERGVAGKPVPVAGGAAELLRLSVPLSQRRWQEAEAALGARPAGVGRAGGGHGRREG